MNYLAMREIVKAMDDDKKQTGAYPYHFDDSFYNRHPQTYRYVYNMEIWTKDSNYEVELSTIYGENYVATAYCNDLNTYEYDTRTAKSLTDIQVFRP